VGCGQTGLILRATLLTRALLVLRLLLNSQIEFVEANFLITKEDVQPNDPQLDAQWALRNTGQNGGQYGSDINATTAWQTFLKKLSFR